MQPGMRSAGARRWSSLLGSLFFLQCTAPGTKPEGERLERIKASAQYRDGKFRNVIERPLTRGSTLGMVRELLFGDQVRVPRHPLPQEIPGPGSFPEPPHALQVVWLGHSTLLLEVDGRRFLIDPVFGSHASPVSVYAKRFQPAPLTREQLPRIDAIVISHDHYDHLEMETMRHFAAQGVPFLVPLGVGSHLEGWGVDKGSIVELDWWQVHDLGGVRLVCTPAQHFSGRSLTDSKQTLWAGWSVLGPVHRVHYSGDGGYADHFRAIGARLGPFDLTLLENGAYDTRWPHVHMFPEEVVQAHLDLRGAALMPVHWGMFNLANHDWYDPIRRVSAAARAQGVRLLTPKLGQVARPGETLASEPWWEPPGAPGRAERADTVRTRL
jgi:L-ascorbate metabolism protein UlaG (beta-lactamase superfamily)